MKILSIQPTPNPNAMKLLLDTPASTATKSYFNAAAGKDDPLAAQLFTIAGIKGVMLLGTMITLTKTKDAAWPPLLAAAHKILESP
jgi:hypothetical protein